MIDCLCAVGLSMLFVIAADAQQAKKKVTPKVVRETPEHVYARYKMEALTESIKDLFQKYPILEKQYEASTSGSSTRERIQDKKDKLLAEMDIMMELRKKAEFLISTADKCALIYKRTASKRAADVLVKEQDAIDACKSLGQYPPLTEDK